MSDAKFQITDQFGELLLECEVGDEYHKLILSVGLNKILKEAIENADVIKETTGLDINTDSKHI